MKTSEIAGYLRDRNARLWIGVSRPLLPLVPMAHRRALDVGWVAFNLIACLEYERSADLANERDPEDQMHLMHNEAIGAFGFFRLRDIPGDGCDGWVIVEWDGYGGLETWKEVEL